MVEEKVVLVIDEVLVKMGEVDDEGKEEDMEDGTGGENIGSCSVGGNMGHCFSLVSSSSSDSSSVTSLLVTSAHALSLASSTVSFPLP